MRKALLLAAVAGLVLGSTALAQDSIIFMDVRDGTSPNQSIASPVYPYIVGGLNNGHAGDAQTLWITPHYANNLEIDTHQKLGWPNTDGDANNSTGKLFLHMTVNTDDSGGTGVISSLGLDFGVTAPTTPRNTLASLSFAWDPLVFAGTNAGKADGTGGPTGWTGAKAVLVPVSGNPPIFDATGGLVPGTTTRIGALSVTGGLRNCTLGTGHATNSTYTVKASVNGLLITRAFGAAPSDAQELVAFGYSAGAPEAPYADGSIAGQTSSLPDGTVVVRLKGDYTGDGRANASDVGSFTTAVNASVTNNHTQLQAFCFDFNGDRRITAGDVSGFTWAVNNTIVCP